MARILVIDDNPIITALLEQVLRAKFHQVEVAQSGQAGVRLLCQRDFDLVITDILMPEFDGIEVIMRINELERRPRVIAMTGGSMNLSQGYLVDVVKLLNVQQVLYKPFTVEQLVTVVGQQVCEATIVGAGGRDGCH